ncbi:MAG: phosphotriesterase family protein [Acidimicrobiales bacterium]
MGAFVRTVLGDVDPGALGAVYCHEHLITRPKGEWIEGDQDLVLDDEARALAELRLFREAGGGTIVEASPKELGRDPEALTRISRSSGVHVVAATGRICETYWRGAIDLRGRSEEEMAAEFVRDLTEGMDGTSVPAGVIKVGSSEGGPTPTERRVMRAASAAHRSTGAPITTHTTAGTAPLAQLDVLESAGVEPHRVCVGHLDRRIDPHEHAEVARHGAFLGYDCIGKEQYQPDAERVRSILRLVEAGHGGQILLGGDMARRSYLRSWGGGPGYPFILGSFLPRLVSAGLAEDLARALIVDNPARFLVWLPPRGLTRSSPRQYVSECHDITRGARAGGRDDA